MSALRICIPPISDQSAIARYLDHADRRIQRQISAAICQTGFLREYRTRLIADAVTGKLDVREAGGLREADPLAGENGTDHTDANLRASEHGMAKEAIP